MCLIFVHSSNALHIFCQHQRLLHLLHEINSERATKFWGKTAVIDRKIEVLTAWSEYFAIALFLGRLPFIGIDNFNAPKCSGKQKSLQPVFFSANGKKKLPRKRNQIQLLFCGRSFFSRKFFEIYFKHSNYNWDLKTVVTFLEFWFSSRSLLRPLFQDFLYKPSHIGKYPSRELESS